MLSVSEAQILTKTARAELAGPQLELLTLEIEQSIKSSAARGGDGLIFYAEKTLPKNVLKRMERRLDLHGYDVNLDGAEFCIGWEIER